MIRVVVATLLLAAFSQTAAAQSDRALRVSFATAVTAHGMDLATSCYCLGAKTCTETNPALGWAEDKPLAFGMAKMGIAAAGLLATSALARHGHPKVAFWFNVAQTVIFTSIAIRNSRTLNR